jgi:endonuclease YncB( thermonuclease family)
MSRIRSASRWWVCAGTLLLAGLGIPCADAAPTCASEPIGEGRIAAVIDARTIRLDDGRVIRLAGLAAPAERPNADEVLSRHIGAEVLLHSDNEAPDRYGRQHAVVYVGDSQTSLQVSLLSAGAAVYDGALEAAGCREEFAASEAKARADSSGVWAATPAVMLSSDDPGEILTRIGQFVIVEGQVRSVRQAGGTHYLNFGRRWTQGFSVTIPNRSAALFEAAGLSLRTLEGRKVRVRGIIDARTGPRLEVSRATQIELAGAEALATAIGTRN